MRWSFPIAKIAGTIVQIHVTFFLLLAWLGGSYYMAGGMQAAVDGLLFILLLFACVIAHEFGHALAARRYGISTPTITLLPIGGVARLQRMPEEPGQEFVVAIAGPLVNVVIAGAIFLVLGGQADMAALGALGDESIGLLPKLFSVNVALVLFNLIPAFPMDGGRILRSLLAMKLSYARATRIAANIGQTLAIFFGILGLFGNILLLLIAVFVFLGAGQEAAVVEMREATRGLIVDEAMVADVPTSGGETSVGEAAEMVRRRDIALLPLVDGEGRPRGVISRDELFGAVQRGQGEASIERLSTRELPSVNRSASLNETLNLMQTEGYQALPVVDDEGRLVGLISLQSIGQLLMMATPRTQRLNSKV
jgi:Zn-dependent protease/CBS domain-containing protein